MKTINVTIVSAEKNLFSGDVAFFVGTSISGELGIYPGHMPLLTQLVPGQVRLTTASGSEEVFWISGGILEIQPNQIIVLAESAERASELDEAVALAAKAKVEQLLSSNRADFNHARAERELRELTTQLDAVERLRRVKKV